MTTKRKPGEGGGTPAIAALNRAGIPHTVHSYDHDPRTPSYGLEAAAALDVEAGRVLKTLLVAVDGRLVVAVVPVSGELDLKALAAAVGGKRAVMADPAAAQQATGYVVGGISPLGQRRPHPTVVDESALSFDRVLVSAGRRGLEVALTPQDLVAASRATVARIRTR